MSYENNIVEIAKASFSFLNYLDNAVFWITNCAYNKQLYLSHSYENIWGRPVEEMIDNPNTWQKTILPEDLNRIMPEMYLRSENKGKGVSAYRIILPSGKINWIKNISHTFTDDSGNPIFIMGIDEAVNQEQWKKWESNIKTDQFIKNNAILANFQTLYKNVFMSQITTQSDIMKTAYLKKKPTFLIGDQEIHLSKRETECLEYLLKGMSAKQTAYSLHLSVRTVESYLDNLRKKAKCRTKIALIGCLQKQFFQHDFINL